MWYIGRQKESQVNGLMLTDLGLTYGLNDEKRTTTTRQGRQLNPSSPAVTAFQMAEPTIMGMMAGCMALLRNPFVLAFLGTEGPSRFMQLNRMIMDTTIAAVFGDSDTYMGVQRMLNQWYRRDVSIESPVLRAATGVDGFVLGEPNRRYAIVMALLGHLAKAHTTVGLLMHGAAGDQYAWDVESTIAAVHSVQFQHQGELTLRDVQANIAMGPQLNAKQAQQAQVPELVSAIMNTTSVPGLTVSALFDIFGGLLTDDTRKALGLTWSGTDVERFAEWAAKIADSPHDDQDTWFEVARPNPFPHF